MIRPTLLLAAAALLPAAARAQGPCSLLTPDQIKAVLNSPVEPGQPGVAKGSNECTWGDAHGEDRVYIALRPAADFRTIRSNIEKSGGQSCLSRLRAGCRISCACRGLTAPAEG